MYYLEFAWRDWDEPQKYQDRLFQGQDLNRLSLSYKKEKGNEIDPDHLSCV
jgi:hypothetical protein